MPEGIPTRRFAAMSADVHPPRGWNAEPTPPFHPRTVPVPPRASMRYHGSMDNFEKRWKRIQDQLRIQMNGDEQPRFSSGRTLFGIRSEAEE